ncbi:phage baseplate assembly protein V [Sphaerotilaceae bacterium SBD11-9]
MADEAVQFGFTQQFQAHPGESPDRKIYGVSVATVINNVDTTGQARVQLQLPWLPLVTPWARLSNMMAGMSRGSYFVPQIGDEVLVSFNHGDVREPYVLGTLWNTMDQPPAVSPTDALTKRMIRTPLGHELSFDEAAQTVTLKSNSQATLTLGLDKAELSTPAAKVTVGIAGDVTITAATKLTLDASVIEIKAQGALLVNGKTISISATGNCAVSGSIVAIN